MCQKQFSMIQPSINQINNYHAEKPFSGNKYSESLNSQLLIHTGQNPYGFNMCQNQFSFKQPSTNRINCNAEKTFCADKYPKYLNHLSELIEISIIIQNSTSAIYVDIHLQINTH